MSDRVHAWAVGLVLALTALVMTSPAVILSFFLFCPFCLNSSAAVPKDVLIAEEKSPAEQALSYRLWRVPWKGLGGDADTFAVQLVSLRRHKEVQVFGSDEKPLEIVWRDAANLEIAVPNLAFVGDQPREAFGVKVHVRFVPDDPEARRKHFEERGR